MRSNDRQIVSQPKEKTRREKTLCSHHLLFLIPHSRPPVPRPPLGYLRPSQLRPHLRLLPRPVSEALLVPPCFLHIPVVPGEFRIDWVHRSSASRPRILERLFPLSIALRTSAHRVFCCVFHCLQFMNGWSRFLAHLSRHSVLLLLDPPL